MRRDQCLVSMQGYNHFMDNFYGQFGAQLNSLGFFAAGIDWRGHGDSEGTRCHVDDFDDLPTSLLRFADTVVVPRVQKLLGKETPQGKYMVPVNLDDILSSYWW